MDNYFSKTLRRLADELEGFFTVQNFDQKLIRDTIPSLNYGSSKEKLQADLVPPGMLEECFMEIVDSFNQFEKLNMVEKKPAPIQTKSNKGSEGHGLATIKEESQMPKLIEGSISTRKDGRFMGRYYSNGIERSVYSRTMIGCINKVNAAVKERDRFENEQTPTKKTTFSAWIQLWFHDYKSSSGKLKASSLEYISSVIRAVEKSSGALGLSGRETGRITADDIDRILNGIEAPKTRLMAFRYLKAAFLTLVKKGQLRKSPFDLVTPPGRPEVNDRYCPTPEELAGFVSWLETDHQEYYFLVEFLSWTGLRIGEALALEWCTVDLEKGSITIREAYDQVTKEDTSPKTSRSSRTLPLFPEARRILDAVPRKGEKVFWFIGKTACKHTLARLTEKYGIPGLSFHGLRHFFATRAFENGVEEKVLRRWMGHSKPLMTDHYTHVNADFENIQIKKMAKKGTK